MSRNAILGIVIVLIILVVGWWLIQSQRGTTTPTSLPDTEVTVETPSPPGQSTRSGTDQTEENSITISSDGFNPKTITIKAGEEVTWMNDDSKAHQVNSDPHPIHTAYAPLNTVGRLQAGDTKSLMFPDAGTYKYHDHLNPSSTGTVVVK